MRAYLLMILLCYSGIINAQSQLQRQKHFNLENGVAIQGYDLVSYFKGKPVEGDKAYAYQYQGVIYFFKNAVSLEQFKKSPASYEPQYGGWCAYAMGAKGEKVEVDPETFKIIDNKLYLFYNKYFNNTLRSWNKDESKLKGKADINWSRFK